MIPGIGASIGGLAGLAPLVIGGTPVTTATQGVAYSGFTASASGGATPYTFSLVGSWPTGISINSSTGAVSGTPTASGTFASLSVRVTDNLGATADLATFTLTVGVSASIRQAMGRAAFINSNGTRQSIGLGAFINEG
jgi:hypothetical protein